jgi:hypothetical protein
MVDMTSVVYGYCGVLLYLVWRKSVGWWEDNVIGVKFMLSLEEFKLGNVVYLMGTRAIMAAEGSLSDFHEIEVIQFDKGRSQLHFGFVRFVGWFHWIVQDSSFVTITPASLVTITKGGVCLLV